MHFPNINNSIQHRPGNSGEGLIVRASGFSNATGEHAVGISHNQDVCDAAWNIHERSDVQRVVLQTDQQRVVAKDKLFQRGAKWEQTRRQLATDLCRVVCRRRNRRLARKHANDLNDIVEENELVVRQQPIDDCVITATLHPMYKEYLLHRLSSRRRIEKTRAPIETMSRCRRSRPQVQCLHSDSGQLTDSTQHRNACREAVNWRAIFSRKKNWRQWVNSLRKCNRPV